MRRSPTPITASGMYWATPGVLRISVAIQSLQRARMPSESTPSTAM